MKVKKVRIGIKSTKKALEEFLKEGEAIEQGQKVKPETAIYFASLSVFRMALTPKRLELLHIIKEKRPSSLQELARISGRNMKNIITDVSLLENLGLIDLHRAKNGRKEAAPRVGYNRISLEIAV
jgi:predicted transcriptional regulator